MTNLSVIITRGLPGCGKTTWARKFMVTSDLKWKRVNRDDLRQMLDSGQYTTEKEEFVKRVELNIIIEALVQGYNVIIDGTNLNVERVQCILAMIEQLHAMGKTNNIAVMFKDFFDVSVNECIKRDKQRENPVGEEVIRKFNNMLEGLQDEEGKS